jgi:hypothetical protein
MHPPECRLGRLGEGEAFQVNWLSIFHAGCCGTFRWTSYQAGGAMTRGAEVTVHIQIRMPIRSQWPFLIEGFAANPRFIGAIASRCFVMFEVWVWI